MAASGSPERGTPLLTIRPFTASDVDFVISRQLALYKSEYGFTSETWIAYLTEGVHTFVNHFDPGKDCMHILENEGVPVGCIAITYVDPETAQLRFFFLEPEMRGRWSSRWWGERESFLKEGKNKNNPVLDQCVDASKTIPPLFSPHGNTL
ncbi:MAG: hypothetical protein Q8R70_01545 [Methanoregula sp.]|nr:hypothetical protein [Methanoregula sp.]